MTVSKLSDNEIAPKRSGSPVVRCDHCRVDHALRDADWARPTATTFGAAIKLAGSLFAGGELADDARRLRPLQPGSQLLSCSVSAGLSCW